MHERLRIIHLYTDGACSIHKDQLGGWGVVLHDPLLDYSKELYGWEVDSSANRMELLAVIKGLEAVIEPCVINITSDSQYVIKANTNAWLAKWKTNGWKTTTGEVKNIDLWVRLDELLQRHTVYFHWVKGHNGHEWNERCDTLAKLGIAAYRETVQ